MRAQFLGGYWQISRHAICFNEGGYVCGLTILFRERFFDVWFKLPRCGARSYRVTRFWCREGWDG